VAKPAPRTLSRWRHKFESCLGPRSRNSSSEAPSWPHRAAALSDRQTPQDVRSYSFGHSEPTDRADCEADLQARVHAAGAR
jgi:hypothetical protein